jgi:hypothetical protein
MVDLIEQSSESELMTVRHEELIARPVPTLERLCAFLDLPCSKDYLHDCSGIIYDSPSRTRTKADWSPKLMDLVGSRMTAIPFLQGYEYDE